MSRIKSTFAKLEKEGKTALIPYVTGGDPRPSVTVGLLHEMVKKGADIIELGIPFSDPMADGPVIQLACERALSHNTSLERVLEMVKEFRQTDSETPIVLMGYLNPIEWMGYQKFVDGAKDAGVDGVLTVDLPPEGADEFLGMLKIAEIDAIFLLTPTTSDARAQKICDASTGYVYYVSVKGVTGSNELNIGEVETAVKRMKTFTSLPVAVGFGIKDGKTAAGVGQVSDGVIVGSVLVNTIASSQNETDVEISSQVSAIIGDMRTCMDNA